MTNNKIFKIINIIFAVLIVGILIVFLGLRINDEVDYSFEDDVIYDWSEDWEINSGVDINAVSSLPAYVEVDRGNTVILSKVLPKTIKKYNCIMIESKRQDITIRVDGILRKSYTDKSTRLIGNSSPSSIVIAPLYNTDAYGVVQIFVTSNTAFSGDIGRVYLGNDMSIILKLIKEDMVWVALDVMLFIIGILCLAGYFIYRKSFDNSEAIIYLFWTSILSFVWCFSKLKIRQVFFGDLALYEMLGYGCLMLLPIPIILYLNRMYGKGNKIVLVSLSLTVFANFLIESILQVITVTKYNFCDMQIITLMILIIILGVALILYYFDKSTKDVYIQIGLASFTISILVEIIFYMVNIDSSARSFTLGALIFLSANLIDTTIGARKDYERKKDAENANEAKSKFLATMSHEIRTPINSVLGMNEMIMRDSNDPVVMEYAQNINSAGNVLLSLINDILDFSKIESGKLELIISKYDTKTLFTDLYNLIEERARKKGLTLDVKLDANMPTSLEGDMGRIRQIITNFLTNAVKYTEKGNVTVAAKMINMDTNPTLHVDIIDTGQGIKDEDKDSLFSSFTRLNEQKNQSIEGTGLGLAITKQLVLLMKGSISVESTFGVGSTFSVDIPQVIADNTPIGEFNPAKGNKNRTTKKFRMSFVYPSGRILIVDDNKTNLIVAAGLLKTTKMQITTATSGDEAIALVKDNEYDLIFMDHMMPVKDGIETLHEIKEIKGKDYATPIIVLTANAISGMRDMYIKEGFNDYLTKPISTKELEELLIRFLGDHKEEE